MKTYFYKIKGIETYTFESLAEARRAYWQFLEADGMEALKLRGHCGEIIRESYVTGKITKFSVR